VSVIVRSFNRVPSLCALLDRLLAQTFPDFEVVVVDQSTTVPPGAGARLLQLARDPRVVLVRRPPLGGAAARNLGVRTSRGDLLLFIDDDDLPVDAHWIEQHVAALADPDCLGVSGRHVHNDEPEHRTSPLFRAVTGTLGFDPILKLSLTYVQHERPTRPVYALHGTNASLRRDAWERFGGWDEDAPIEDEVSFCFRAQRLKRPAEYFAYDPGPVILRNRDIPGGLAKRLMTAPEYFARYLDFVHRIIGRYYRARLVLLYPLYLLVSYVLSIGFLWKNSRRYRTKTQLAGAALGLLFVVPREVASALRRLSEPSRAVAAAGEPRQGGPEPALRQGDLRTLRRNVLVGAFGLAARGAQVLLLFAVSRLFGGETLGQLLLALGLFELVGAISTTGFVDATALFVGRHAAGAATDGGSGLRRTLSTALLAGGGLAVALAASAQAASGLLSDRIGPAYSALLPALPWLIWALVPTAVARIAFSASSGLLRIEWEALLGAAGAPLLLLLASPLIAAAGGGLRALFAALFFSQLALAGIALAVLRGQLRRCGLSATGSGAGKLDQELLAFALPQGLNVAANHSIARIDVVLLALFGTPAALVGVYGTLTALVLELRQTRMVVSAALGPLVARRHAQGDRAALASLLSRSAAWVSSLAVPVALAALFLRDDLIRLLAPSAAEGSGIFALLLLGPLVNCLGGLAGNFLVFLLHNRWNLLNSLCVAGLHVALACWLIPHHGLLGAAAATTAGIAAVTLLESWELRHLEGLAIGARSLLPAIAALLAIGAALELVRSFARPELLAARLALGAAGALLAHGAIRAGPGFFAARR
jgi:O-antigen/teichoic acid export membrane protein/glycosyltransferase involved in cell wall biosynthesis